MSWQRELALEAAATSDPDRLRELSTHRLTRVRVAVAGNPGSPADVLASLTDDRHHLPRFAVTRNRSEAAVTAALAADQHDVRMVLAHRHDLDEATSEALLSDPSWEVRVSLVNSTGRSGLVARAARSDDPRVRAAAAESDLCTDEDFELLSRDPSWWVRGSVATIPGRLTADMVERLARDRSTNVRWALGAHQRPRWEWTREV